MVTADGPRLAERHSLVQLDSCGSTNAEAMARAMRGEPLPLWVITERQTAGRGRSGRNWTGGAGNLMASLALPVGAPVPMVAELSLVAGNAALDALLAAVPNRMSDATPGPPGSPAAPGAAAGWPMGLRLKWPNDILLDGVKLGGILVESALGRDGVLAVIGFGLNLATHPTDLGRAAASLPDCVNKPSPLDMLVYLSQTMQHWLAVWDEGRGFAAVRSGWLERAGPVGERLSVNTGAGPVTGSFAGLDDSGALLMDTAAGRTQRFTFGDVTLADS